MKSDVKTSLLLLKNKLLLLSLVSTLGATSIGCSSNSFDNDEVESVLETTEEKIEESITVIPDTTLEIEEKLPDSKEDVMNIIDNGIIESIYYVKNDTTLTIPSFLTESKVEEQVTLPKLECLEVYDILDDTCLVKTNEYIGFTTLENLEELIGTFVVVDISSQEVKLYCNNEVILTTPVVTGKPSTPSDKGLFEIYDISHSRYLVGPNYKSYVDIMMKYNGGEGLHDAQYHTHEDGFKHGWRDASEFGGDTYLKHGSHGCINMIHDDVMTVSDYVDIGTKVLVKE
jgi:conserved hypothetical protein